MKDTVAMLGKLVEGPVERDAVHIAVVPMVAGEMLTRGDPIGILRDGTAGYGATPIGVVDPFLPHDVAKGQTFWLFLNPGSITSLRHEWTHPAFDTPEALKKYKEKS